MLSVTTLGQLQTLLTRSAFATLNKAVAPALASGLANPLPIGVGAVVLETTGAHTGLPRRVPLMAARLGNRVAVSTVRPNSHWFANLEAHPVARVQLHGRHRAATARLSRGPLNVAVLTT